jgi:hypothetical protein
MTFSSLGLTAGQKFKLTAEDYADVNRSKNQTAQFGMAIDAHIKNYLQPKGIVVPDDKYATLDFDFQGTAYDIKSYAGTTITISAREKGFADSEIRSGRDVIYAIFEQLTHPEFKFKGYVSYKALIEHNKIRNSKFGDSFYFSLGSARLL